MPLKHDNQDAQCYYGGAIKAVGNGIVEGHLIVFTDASQRDLTGEYFDKETNLYPDDYPVENATVMFHHGLDDTIGARRLGKVLKSVTDDVGVWVRAQLDMRDAYEEWVYKLAEKGKLGWSSGTLPGGSRVAKNGHIDVWPVIDATLTPAPAMPFATQIEAVKALPLSLRELIAREDTSTAVDDKTNDSELAQSEIKGLKTMDVDKIKQLIAAFAEQLLAMLGGDAAPPAPPEEEMKAAADDASAEVEEEKKEAEAEAGKSLTHAQIEAIAQPIAEKYAQAIVEKAMERNASRNVRAQKAADAMKAKLDKGVSKVGGYSNPGRERPADPKIQVGDNLKYAHMSASDMALGLKLSLLPLQQAGFANPNPLDAVSADYYKTMVGKMEDQTPFKAETFVNYKGEHAAHPEWVKSVDLTNRALKTGIPIKANELDASNIATQGQEWVGQWWESDIWLRAREVRIYQELIRKGMMQKDIPQGYSTAKFPIEGNDPTVYTAPEANSVDSTGRPEVTAKISPFTTGNVTLTPKEWKAATSYTVVLGEDSIVDVAPQVNYQLTEKIQETIEQGFINGDTVVTASTNINNIDGTPGTGLSTPYYIAFDGFRKLPLVTATSYSRDAGNSLSLEDYRATLQKFDSPLRSRAEKLCFIIDADTETSSLAIPELATDDVRHTFATITSGVLRNVYGVDVFKSGFMLLSNTAGKVAVVTPTNNKRGTILAIYAPYWGFGYKRQITIETARDILSGSNIYVASLRLGVIARGTNAAALSYNIQNGNG